MSDPSFANDIAPILFPYRGQMAWRLDLASYEQVKANAGPLYAQISQGSMPPPPFTAFPDSFVETFKAWMAADCPA